MNKVATVILENEDGKILMYLRDDNPNIPFPNHWDLFGGHLENNETPEQAIKGMYPRASSGLKIPQQAAGN